MTGKEDERIFEIESEKCREREEEWGRERKSSMHREERENHSVSNREESSMKRRTPFFLLNEEESFTCDNKKISLGNQQERKNNFWRSGLTMSSTS